MSNYRKLKNPKFSIIIATLGRSKSLKRCLDSIAKQTYKNYEIIIVKEKPLCRARNIGANKAKGLYLTFIDDDVVVNTNWLEAIKDTFRNLGAFYSEKEIGGVTGPTIIPKNKIKNRDLSSFLESKNPIYKLIANIIMEGHPYVIGRYYSSCAFSFGANYEWAKSASFRKSDWLFSCNMAIRKDIFLKVGGFDETYSGCGDFSEPDIAFKIRKLGYDLIFHPNVYVYHHISKQRGDIVDMYTRVSNMMKFHNRYFKFNWRYFVHLLVINAYCVKKAIETKNLKWLGGIKAWKCLFRK